MNSKDILVLVTARAGSKRLPNKNLLELNDKPLIAWTIQEALKSKYICDIVVSTDSQIIADIATKYGASVPFLRPNHLANDLASSFDVIVHAIDFFKNTKLYKYILLLQPTSPLRTTSNIDQAIEAFVEKKSKAVVSVCQSEHSPLWSNTLPANLSMANFIRDDIKNMRSQDLPTFYRLNGAIYFAEIEYFIENKGFMGNQTNAYIMSSENSIDIDNLIDFKLAEVVLKTRDE
ncbi:MAG: acylneuraminate cytidylyltransferase family protein [Bacteroidales bacterium]|nr:acylneuraminate cytidylyltransferase family protein [Bacteroidales bacterium]